MTQLMRNLPKDLQREVWSFLGMDSLGKTPSGLAFNQFYDDLDEYYKNNPHMKGDKKYDVKWYSTPELELTFNKIRDSYDNIIPHWLGSGVSYRNYVIFNYLFKEQREFDNSKFIKLNSRLIGLWKDKPHCKVCDHHLTAKEFKFIDYHENLCDDCYGIKYKMMKDEDYTDKFCSGCYTSLSVSRFKEIRNRYDEFWLCIPCEEARDSDNETIYLDSDEEAQEDD
jgi:hypothetical protein